MRLSNISGKLQKWEIFSAWIPRIFLIVFFFCPAAFLIANPVPVPSSDNENLKADVVLLALPVVVKTPLEERTVDALERSPETMPADWKIVVFRIERVLKGRFKTLKGQDASLWSQMKDAAGEKDLLKLATMDFEKPDEEPRERQWFSMAVADPFTSFAIREGEPLPKQSYKVSLALIHRDPPAYLLRTAEKA